MWKQDFILSNSSLRYDQEPRGQGSHVPPQQPCCLYPLQQHSPLLRKFYPSEDWLSSICLTSVIAQELVFPSWHLPQTTRVGRYEMFLLLLLLLGRWHFLAKHALSTRSLRKAYTFKTKDKRQLLRTSQAIVYRFFFVKFLYFYRALWLHC